jgi:hypothetical protein
VCSSSFFIQLIGPIANSVFEFREAHLTEIGVGRTELKLHDIHLALPIYLPRFSTVWMQVHAVENQRVERQATMFLPLEQTMKEDEKKRLSAVLRSTEYLLLEEVVLTLALEPRRRQLAEAG